MKPKATTEEIKARIIVSDLMWAGWPCWLDNPVGKNQFRDETGLSQSRVCDCIKAVQRPFLPRRD